ncbi:MAG TPA: ribonuclease HI family protein [Coriobacteriia bacterium]
MSPAFVLRTDGGARGNPGPAGAGFVLEDPSGVTVRSGGRFLGEATNNVAEYEALVWGLRTALDQGVRDIQVRADSELVVKQVNGHYRVKNAGLAPLHAEACALLSRFASAKVVHVRRAENEAADALANEAMDLRGEIGDGVAAGDGRSRLF